MWEMVVLKGDFARRGRVCFLYFCVVRVRFWHDFDALVRDVCWFALVVVLVCFWL